MTIVKIFSNYNYIAKGENLHNCTILRQLISSLHDPPLEHSLSDKQARLCGARSAS